MKIKSKKWIMGYFIIVIGLLGIVGRWVVMVDPFFHYHEPDIATYFYSLDNERSQNDGIIKNFEYDAVLTGTSLVENFRTSEVDSLFGVDSIKICFAGASYKEINDNLIKVLKYNPDVKMIIRGLDMAMFFDQSDRMRVDLGEFPEYLYDSNVFNDVKYVFNRDVIFKRVYPMTKANDEEEFEPGITTFDEYSNWMSGYTFGVNTVYPKGIPVQEAGSPVHLTEEEKATIHENIYKNVISLPEKYPGVAFYYFFPPYSISFWQNLVRTGGIYKQVEAEQYIIEQILECENIKLFSFNNRTDITTDLNNYKDTGHYGMWINSLMLRWIYDGRYLLTKDNYMDYLLQEFDFYASYDYNLLKNQVDYEYDYFADALLNKEINGVDPVEILVNLYESCDLEQAQIVENQYDNRLGIECVGTLGREIESKEPVADYLLNSEYIGCKVTIEEIDDYRYLVFYGKRNAQHGQPGVYVYDEDGKMVAELTEDWSNIDDSWHAYLLDISEVNGKATIIFNGGYINESGSQASSYTFSNMILY